MHVFSNSVAFLSVEKSTPHVSVILSSLVHRSRLHDITQPSLAGRVKIYRHFPKVFIRLLRECDSSPYYIGTNKHDHNSLSFSIKRCYLLRNETLTRNPSFHAGLLSSQRIRINMTECISNSNARLPKRQKRVSTSHDPSKPSLNHLTIYQPLDKAKREIRICDLNPASRISAKLECSLRIVPIDAAGKFVAFSYVWGREADTDTIYIDGVEHRIKPNLAAGLRQFRARYRQDPRLRMRLIPIWVDAICINQDSTEERNHQVPLMRSIFSGCEYTFSWLGEAGQDSDFAMDCIAKIAKIASVKEAGKSEYSVQRSILEMFCEARPWVAIHNLLRRDFWYRVWIFQELILPADLVIACGPKSLPWKSFQELEYLRGCDDELECDAREIRMRISHLDSETQEKVVAVFRTLQELFIILSRDNHYYKAFEKGNFGSLLYHTMHLQATDPRDKIYGILALSRGIDIRPDYSKTVRQIYTDLAISILPHDSTLLKYSGINFGKNINGPATTPSWVLDWDYITQHFTTSAILPIRQIDPIDGGAGKKSSSLKKLEFEHLQDITALHVRGQIWQEIIRPTPAQKWLNSQYFSTTIHDMYGSFYPRPSKECAPQKPIPKLVALFFTLTKILYCSVLCGHHGNLAAGFCVNTFLRINNAFNVTEYTPELSLSALLQIFAEQFESWHELVDLPEMYKHAYLAKETEELQERVFFTCPTGHFGIGPSGARDGDFICKLYGFFYPFILRKVDSHYVLVGSCWVLGFMSDQELDEDQSVMLEIW
jgi:hypothetical protein